VSPNRQRAILVRQDGKEQFIGYRDAESRIEAGTATYLGKAGGFEMVAEQRLAIWRDRLAMLWVKDRGVRGGRYDRPFEPNGNRAQMTLVRQ
jgi:hypothetical protein